MLTIRDTPSVKSPYITTKVTNTFPLVDLLKRLLQGGLILKRDNTKVIPPLVIKKAFRKPPVLDRIYDLRKAKYYLNMLNFYNNNFFGIKTNFDPTTEEGQRKILSSFNYSKSNVNNLGSSLIGEGVIGSLRGILPLISKRATIGNLSSLLPYKIGEGSEAIVIKNSPTTVGKITLVGSGEMLKRNSIPNAEKLKFVGYVRDKELRLPTFIQRKLKVVNELTYPKYINKLDKAMLKSGFRKVSDPDVKAYTNGTVVIDDISPDNIGVNWAGRPKLINFNLQSVPEWLELRYILRNGGKFKIF